MAVAWANVRTTGKRFAVLGLRLMDGTWVYQVIQTGRRRAS